MSSYKHQAMLAMCDAHKARPMLRQADELLLLLWDFGNSFANDFLGHSIHLGVIPTLSISDRF